MNYQDDELERMRARREGRSSQTGRTGQTNRSSYSSSVSSAGRKRSSTDSSRSTRTRSTSGGTTRRTSSSSTKSSGTRGTSGRRTSNYRKAARRKKHMIIALEIAVIILMLLGGGLWYIYHRTFGSLQQIEFNEEQVKNVNLSQEQIDDMKGYMTVACFGVDSRSEHGTMNVGKGTNSDVNMIANINLETGEIRLVSVFRDSYLNINDKNSYNKINAAYAQGGPEQAVKALNKNLGLNITQYATFNWKAVADAINILGGVDVELSDAEFSWINAFITETVKETGIGSYQLTHAGNVHLDGIQAVAYGRIRYSDTDYARTERQRIILQKAFEKAKNADWATLNCLLQTITPQLATNIDVGDLIPLARRITKFHIGETAGFPAARGEQDVGKIGDCVIPQTLEYNVKELHKFLFDEADYQVPANVKEYSNHIAQVTGLTKNAKLIGHVPVDQGVTAQSYIRRKASRAAAKAAAEAAAKKSTSASKESEEESKEESKTEESTSMPSQDESLDPDEDWIDWGEEESRGSNGPGTAAAPTASGKNNYTDKTTEADAQISGPGGNTSETTSIVKPGAGTEAGTSAFTETSGQSSPGASGNSSVKSPAEEIQSQVNSGASGPAGPGA